MKKEVLVLSFVILSFAMVALVAAAGTSTGGTNTGTERTVSAVNAAACETRAVLKDRIQCRMQARSNVKSIEESCRALPLDKQSACTRLQNDAAPCYDKSAQEKSSCLRTNAGLGAGQMNRFAPEDRRKYAALLMYELQERVEAKQESSQLTEEQSAELIAQIVEIKQSLLNNAPIADVKEKMGTFKIAYLDAMRGTSS